MTVKEYVKKDGGECPFCGSSEIEGNAVCVEVPFALQPMRCLDCDRDWTDVYKLVSYRK